MNSGPQNKMYQICLKGRLDHKRMAWFGALEIDFTDTGDTILRVDIRDQPALFGILDKIRDTGLELISVRLTS